MIKRIRVATPEEVKSIEKVGDLSIDCAVLALDTPEGVPLAVVRRVMEVDPVIYPEGLPGRLKLVFQRDIETVLAAQGVQRYYFNVHASNEKMIETVKALGAIEQSTEPEIRFLKVL